MTKQYLYQNIPKCIEDKNYLHLQNFIINFPDNSYWGHPLHQCPKCDKYLTENEKGEIVMEKDLKKAMICSLKKMPLHNNSDLENMTIQTIEQAIKNKK